MIIDKLFKKKPKVDETLTNNLPSETKLPQTKENETVTTTHIPAVNTPVIDLFPTRHYNKKRFYQIRNSIIFSLKSYPKTTDEVAKDIGSCFVTTEKHLKYLQDLGIVRKGSFKLRDREKSLWVIK
jgi:hypothetical protein